MAKENKSIDCHHWLNGRCKFQEKNCKFKHDIAKKSVNVSKRKRSEDEDQHKDSSQQDFLLGLVRALAQGSTGEAGLVRVTEPARGLEGQRNIQSRMVSPNSSTGGVEGQRIRSYANVVDSHRMESQRSNDGYRRQRSPPRGMQEQGGVDQLVEKMRGMVRPPQSAPQVDSLQEGLQLLMQIAQQAGRM